MFTVLPTLKYKTQLTTECLLSDSCILCNCITIVDALTRNLMLQWLILAALDVATQPNLHRIEFYIPVQEKQDFVLLFFLFLQTMILKKYKCV